ncbi:hypothetical protein EYF80_045336 [Liparis tanakae]|uniref:Uncharacterized protein n=1 Tax=Liparis tanakae TaxID=230148 RepID=A0A4Z2FTD6_9TELE|nr:hypothetical protein EYF80_045336 [Liparis tanakae]
MSFFIYMSLFTFLSLFISFFISLFIMSLIFLSLAWAELRRPAGAATRHKGADEEGRPERCGGTPSVLCVPCRRRREASRRRCVRALAGGVREP